MDRVKSWGKCCEEPLVGGLGSDKLVSVMTYDYVN